MVIIKKLQICLIYIIPSYRNGEISETVFQENGGKGLQFQDLGTFEMGYMKCLLVVRKET